MASSDVMIRNTYRQVMGREAPESVVRASRGVPDNELAEFFKAGGGSSGDPAVDLMTSILDDINSKAAEFDDKNPFSFDEVLAREASEQNFDPYYQAELRDYVTGANKARGRTAEDEQKFRTELDTTTEQIGGRLKRTLDETIRSNEEGFAGSNLLFSGAKERATGMAEIEGDEGLSTFIRKQGIQKDESLNRQNRQMTDVADAESTFRRRQTAERETALTTDVELKRKEANQRREAARSAYIGIPGYDTLGSYLRS